MKNSIVSPTFIKQIARQLKKEKSLSQSQALNEAVRKYGFSNYRNYQKTLKDNLKHSLLDIIKQFHHSEENIQAVCEKSNLKDEIQSFLLNDFLSSKGRSEIEMFYEFYIAKNISVSNLLYEISGDMIRIDGEYKLITEFEFEVPDCYKGYPHFEDRSFSGTFEVTIDKNKKINIVYSDIGDDNDLGFTGFTEEELEDYYRRFPNERGRFNDILVLDDYDDVKYGLANNEPLTGKMLERALELVDVLGDDEHSRFVRNIGVKMKAGQLLDEYEHHILVDVLMLHAQLGS